MATKKKKTFLKTPEYPGGKTAFQQFIKENMVYPVEAIQQNIQGVVQLEVSVNDSGIVTNAQVINGIGGGCDEEALRLARMMRYGTARNRGVRLSAKKRVKILFQTEKQEVMINYEVEKKQDKEGAEEDVYSYTITI